MLSLIHICGCSANAFLGGLEDELHLAAEGLLVVGEPLRDAKAHGRVAVVSAGVGEAGTRGGEALAVGQMVFVLRLLDGEAVDVEAKRGDGTGTARVCLLYTSHGRRSYTQTSARVIRARLEWEVPRERAHGCIGPRSRPRIQDSSLHDFLRR